MNPSMHRPFQVSTYVPAHPPKSAWAQCWIWKMQSLCNNFQSVLRQFTNMKILMDAKICYMLGVDPYWRFYECKINGHVDNLPTDNRASGRWNGRVLQYQMSMTRSKTKVVVTKASSGSAPCHLLMLLSVVQRVPQTNCQTRLTVIEWF